MARDDFRSWSVASSAALQRYVRSWSTSRHNADILSVPPQPRHASLNCGEPRSSSGSLAMFAAMRPGRHRSPGALTCAKLQALCAGGCLRTNHLFAPSTQTGPRWGGVIPGCVHRLAPVGNMAGVFFVRRAF